MDEQVVAAMKRWPDVPDVYGWLRLDRRGRWLLIDRNRPDFDAQLHGHGSPITNTQIVDFIARNYQRSDDGCWYWQNGPQRVFVELDVAPWVYRVMQSAATGPASSGSTPAAPLSQSPAPQPPSYSLLTHTGLACQSVTHWQMSGDGVLYALTEHGPGAIHDLDLSVLPLELQESPDDGAVSGSLDWNGRPATIGPLDQRMTGFVLSPLRRAAV